MKSLLIIIISLISFSIHIKSQSDYTDSIISIVQDCDLFFQISDASNAITDVTDGVGSLNIEHVGIYANIDGREVIIESIPRAGVCITSVDSFLCRNVSTDGKPMVIIGRVCNGIDRKQSLKNALEYVGCGYDSLFIADNNEIYCSELVQKSFVDNDSVPVFSTIPMTFRDKEGHIPDYWLNLYARHGMNVPENEPGTNPGEMSRRKNINIIFSFIK